MQMVIQLCLRQEDSINVMRMDRAYLMLFKTQGGETVLSMLKDVADKWKELKAAGTTDCPLRVALYKCMVLELQTRAKAMVDTKLDLLIRQGWVVKKEGQEPCWLPLMYNKEKQQDVPVPDLGPLPHSDAMNALQQLLVQMDGQLIQRFHATRPMATTYKGEMLAFLLEVSTRGANPLRVHQALGTLSHSAIWFLIGTRLRPDTPKRSPLATKLQAMLGNQC